MGRRTKAGACMDVDSHMTSPQCSDSSSFKKSQSVMVLDFSI